MVLEEEVWDPAGRRSGTSRGLKGNMRQKQRTLIRPEGWRVGDKEEVEEHGTAVSVNYGGLKLSVRD